MRVETQCQGRGERVWLAKMSTENLFVDIEEIAVLENTNFESMTLMFLILETVFTRFAEYRIKKMQEKR